MQCQGQDRKVTVGIERSRSGYKGKGQDRKVKARYISQGLEGMGQILEVMVR